MKIQVVVVLMLLFGTASMLQAQQKVMTKTGEASFFSKAPLEDIEAHNKQVVAIIDLSSKEIAVKMLIKQFNFEKSLMQEHFNENYMESDKYPSATFSGKIEESPEILLTESGEYEVKIVGELQIHGIKKPWETMATLTVKDGKVSAKTNFKVKTADFKIEIPKLVIKNIAETIDVNLNFSFEPIS